jgi:D-alanyl-D-alanine carboxypeptidase/D-alanyl-D-alanine-endopeptidase (penicillin-binding protein 4)
MKFRTAVLLLGVLLVLPARVSADLAGEIRAVLNENYFKKAEVGIAIIDLSSDAAPPKSIFRHQSDIPLMPASNLKLLTTSAALDRLGGDFKFRTTLLVHDQDVYLIGDGDPTLGDYELIKNAGWDVTTVFKSWAAELRKRNVTSVRNVIVDDSVFDEIFVHPSWSTRYASAAYSAGVAGVNLNANCANFYLKVGTKESIVSYLINPPTRYLSVKNTCISGSSDEVALGRVPGKNEIVLSGQAAHNSIEPICVTVHDPAMYAATVLSETLASEGISVSGGVSRDRSVRERAGKDAVGWPVVAELQTPMAPVLARANKDSMNLYAEALCKRLGYAVSGESGSWANGTGAVGEFLKKIGVDESQFHLDDGCGLSRQNNVSAGAIATLLAYDFHSKNKQVFLDSLGVAGQDGTLKGRFKGSDLRERVMAKSGYIDGVSSLSGYLKTKNDRWIAFSILMNDLPVKTNNTAKEMQERIVSAVDRSAAP